MQLEHPAVGGVIVYDQEPLTRQLHLFYRQVGSLLESRRRFGRDGEVEDAAFANLAFHPHPPTQQLRQAFADGQAQAGAAVLAGGGGVHLRERAEQAVQPVRGDADARVSYHKMQDIPRRAGVIGLRSPDALLDLYREHHFAFFSELQGVVEQVDEDLPQAGHVTHDCFRYAFLEHQRQLDPLGCRNRGQQVQGGLQALAQVEGRRFQLHLAGLDLGEVQDVVDDGEQPIAAAADDLYELHLLGGQFRVEQQPAHADDGIHRGADLVAHGSQESALGFVGRVGDFPCLAVFLEQVGFFDRTGGLLGKQLQQVQVCR